MNSLDFLTPREVIVDCVRLAAIPSLVVALVGGISWALLAVFGTTTDEEPAYALLMPFAFSAIYGNVVIYNTRWKHGIRAFGHPWWFRLAGLAIAWTVVNAILGLFVNFVLVYYGIVDRDAPSLLAVMQIVGLAVAFSFACSLIPAKDQYVT